MKSILLFLIALVVAMAAAEKWVYPHFGIEVPGFLSILENPWILILFPLLALVLVGIWCAKSLKTLKLNECGVWLLFEGARKIFPGGRLIFVPEVGNWSRLVRIPRDIRPYFYPGISGLTKKGRNIGEENNPRARVFEPQYVEVDVILHINFPDPGLGDEPKGLFKIFNIFPSWKPIEDSPLVSLLKKGVPLEPKLFHSWLSKRVESAVRAAIPKLTEPDIAARREDFTAAIKSFLVKDDSSDYIPFLSSLGFKEENVTVGISRAEPPAKINIARTAAAVQAIESNAASYKGQALGNEVSVAVLSIMAAKSQRSVDELQKELPHNKILAKQYDKLCEVIFPQITAERKGNLKNIQANIEGLKGIEGAFAPAAMGFIAAKELEEKKRKKKAEEEDGDEETEFFIPER